MKIYEVQGVFVVAQGPISVFDRACNLLAVKDHGFVERAERIRFVPVAEPVTGPMPRIDEGRDDDHFAKTGEMVEPEVEPEPEESIEVLVTEAEAEWAKQNAEKAAAEKLWSERKAAQAKEAKAFKAKPVIKTKPQVTPTTGLSKLEPRPEPKKSNLPAVIKSSVPENDDPLITLNLTGLSRMAQLHGSEILALHERYHSFDEIVLVINAKTKRNDHVNPRIVKSVITEMERHKRDALMRLEQEGAS